MPALPISSTYDRASGLLATSVPLRIRSPQGCGRKQARPSATTTGKPVSRRHGRSLVVRADVNWDAFRSEYEVSLPGVGQNRGPAVRQYDFLVIGSGIAGLSYALKVAAYGKVAIITKSTANDGCTQYAQGGVCAVLDQSDSVADHVRDTMVAGAFLNDQQAVEIVCREGPARVLELVKLGADFTRNNDGTLHLTREGGHSHRRVVHAADLTGKEIERAMLCSAKANKNIDFFEHHLAVDLVVEDYMGAPHCFGVDVLDQKEMRMCRFLGLATLLASGGAGQVYPNTTNPAVATGDGMAMAYRAQASISNMEFVQFHPTGLYTPPGAEHLDGGRTFLITEALRGEGAHLKNLDGHRFMQDYDSRLELAPRDIVARCITDQMAKREEPHVWLDISHQAADKILHHFPNIAAKCASQNIDITKDPIPVVPVQHYMCGGVNTGLYGETNVLGLFACGEVACSGLHGANRLASNSLLEGLVFGDRAVAPSIAHAEYSLKNLGRELHYAAASADFTAARGARSPSAKIQTWAHAKRAELRQLMWRCCGIVRRVRDIHQVLDFANGLAVETRAVIQNYGVNTSLVELRNLVSVAEMTAACALQRKESRGLHYVLDYPESVAEECRPSVVTRRPRKQVVPQPSLAPAKSNSVVGTLPQGYLNPNAKVRRAVQRDLAVRTSPQDL